MPDRVQGLDIEMHRQGEFIEFQSDSLGIQGLKIAAQGKIDIRPGMRTAKSTGAEDDGFADFRMPGQNAPDGLNGIWSEVEAHDSRVSAFSSAYISSITAR